ncbi:MAG: helix-hairpin-helix domain-containing protein [Bacteroidia bacterium]
MWTKAGWEEELNHTIEHCVNAVGVNLNTASEKLLTCVSGLGTTLAKISLNIATTMDFSRAMIC